MVRDVAENKTNIKHLEEGLKGARDDIRELKDTIDEEHKKQEVQREKLALIGIITASILFPILTGLIIKKWIDSRKVGARLDRPTADDYQEPKSELREVDRT